MFPGWESSPVGKELCPVPKFAGAGYVLVSWSQARILSEEETSTEKIPSSDWSLGKFIGVFS